MAAQRCSLSAQMTALELMLPDGQTKKMIVRRPGDATLKRTPHAAAHEFKLLQTMQSVGVAAQTPYYLDQSCEIFPTPYIVIEYIEGKPEFAPSNLDDYTLQVARQLARIHRIDDSTVDLAFLPKQAKGIVEKVRERYTIDDHSVPQLNKSVLLHGDFWPGNMLWNNDRLMAVIDWEDAELGDPLADFAVSRLDILLIFGIEAMNDFTHHYQSLMPINFTNLPY